MARVVYRDENYQTVYVDLNVQNPEVTIGRSAGNMIQIPSKSLSRNHAKIVFQGGRYIFIDLRSSNGSYVNNTRIQTQEIQPGDAIKCGDVSLEFTDGSPAGGINKGAQGSVRGIEAPRLSSMSPNVPHMSASSEQRGINIRPISTPGNYRPTMPNQLAFDQDMAQMLAQQASQEASQEAAQQAAQQSAPYLLDAARVPANFNPTTMGPPQNVAYDQSYAGELQRGRAVAREESSEAVPRLERGMVDAAAVPRSFGPTSMGYLEKREFGVRPDIQEPQQRGRAVAREESSEAVPRLERGMADAAAIPRSFDPTSMGYLEQRESNARLDAHASTSMGHSGNVDAIRQPSQEQLNRLDELGHGQQGQMSSALGSDVNRPTSSDLNHSVGHGGRHGVSSRYTAGHRRPSRPSLSIRDHVQKPVVIQEQVATRAITHKEFIDATGGHSSIEHDDASSRGALQSDIASDLAEGIRGGSAERLSVSSSSSNEALRSVDRSSRQRATIPARELGPHAMGLQPQVPASSPRNKAQYQSRVSQDAFRSRAGAAVLARQGRGYARQRYAPEEDVEQKQVEAGTTASLESSANQSSIEQELAASVEQAPALVTLEANQESPLTPDDTQPRLDQRASIGQSEIVNIEDLYESEDATDASESYKSASVLPKANAEEAAKKRQMVEVKSQRDDEYLQKLKLTIAQQKEVIQALRDISAEMGAENKRLHAELETAQALNKEDESALEALKLSLNDAEAKYEAIELRREEEAQEHADEIERIQKHNEQECEALQNALDEALDEGVVANFKNLWRARFEQMGVYADALEAAVDTLELGKDEAKAVEQVRSIREIIAFCAKEL